MKKIISFNFTCSSHTSKGGRLHLKLLSSLTLASEMYACCPSVAGRGWWRGERICHRKDVLPCVGVCIGAGESTCRIARLQDKRLSPSRCAARRAAVGGGTVGATVGDGLAAYIVRAGAADAYVILGPVVVSGAAGWGGDDYNWTCANVLECPYIPTSIRPESSVIIVAGVDDGIPCIYEW